MAVTPHWSEYLDDTDTMAAPDASTNGGGGVALTNTNWGSTNAVNLNTSTFPVTAGLMSFFKQHAVRFTITASEQISGWKLWSASLVGGAGVLPSTPGSQDRLKVLNTGNQTFVDPTTATIGTTDMPNSSGTALAITAPSTPITISGDGTHLFRHQVQTNAATTAGVTTVQLSFQYDVTA